MGVAKYCNNKECQHCKRGLCKNKVYKTHEDIMEKCPVRKLCYCRVGEVETTEKEVKEGDCTMIVARCIHCDVMLKSYPKDIVGKSAYERLKMLIDKKFNECIEDRKRCDEGNHHVDALYNEGASRILCDLKWFTEHMSEE